MEPPSLTREAREMRDLVAAFPLESARSLRYNAKGGRAVRSSSAKVKKGYLAAELAAVLIFIVLPPLLTANAAPLQSALSLPVLFELLIATALEVQHALTHKSAQSESRLIIRILKGTPLTLAALMLAFALFYALSGAAPPESGIAAPEADARGALGGSLSYWLNAAAVLAVAAFFEEAVYRRFLPETLCDLTVESSAQCRAPRRASEATCVLLFAFAHAYAGIFSVLNALVSGAVLRLCSLKSGSIVPPFLAHFLYNMILLLLACLQVA